MWIEAKKARIKNYTSAFAKKEWYYTPKGKIWPLYKAMVIPAFTPEGGSDIVVIFSIKRKRSSFFDSNILPNGIPLELMQIFLTHLQEWVDKEVSSAKSRPTSNKRLHPKKSTSVHP